MDLQLLQEGIDAGGILCLKGNTERCWEVIKAIPYGVGRFYNGDKVTGASTLASLVERAHINLDEWRMVAREITQRPTPYVQLSFIESDTL